MRIHRLLSFATLAWAAACRLDGAGPLTVDPDAPSNLTYQLVPSGDPLVPAGIILYWDPPASGRAVTYDVYGRNNTANWGLRATTTSPTFHDAGIPQAQYYVVARDGNNNEIGSTEPVAVDERNRLPAPASLGSITLNGAVQLQWSDNVMVSGSQRFDYYRVYSALYDTLRGTCSAQWYVEGTTATESFYVGKLDNGVTLCFAVSAVSLDGHESPWSNTRMDTPRYDAKNVRVYVGAVRADSGAFLFLDETTGKRGVVAATSRLDADMLVQRQADGTIWFAPARSGVTVQQFGSAPVVDLSSMDRAPLSGYQSVLVEAQPGFGYVFRVQKNDGAHYAAVRVSFVAKDYVVLDWSYQSAPGNAELSRVGGR